MFSYNINQSGNSTMIKIEGDLTMGRQSQELGQELVRYKDQSNVRICFDCTDLRTIDSSGIGVMLVFKKLVDDMSGVMVMVVPKGGMVYKALTMASLHEIFNLFQDIPDALGFLKNCHVEDSELVDSVSDSIAGTDQYSESRFISEVSRRYEKIEDALEIIERLVKKVFEKENSPVVEAVHLNRIVRLIHLLEQSYNESRKTDAGCALVVAADESVAASYIVEAFLQIQGYSTLNTTGGKSAMGAVEELSTKHSPNVVVFCPAKEADLGTLESGAGAVKKANESAVILAYIPLLKDAAPASDKIKIASSISQAVELISAPPLHETPKSEAEASEGSDSEADAEVEKAV